MIFRAGIGLVSILAGVGVGALVFKTLGEEKIGGEVKNFAGRMGFSTAPGSANGALDLLDAVAPGTADKMKSAVIFTVIVSLVAATAVAVSVEEIAS